MTAIRVAPCAGCELRHPGCHAKCEDYNTWRDELLETSREIRSVKRDAGIVTQYSVRMAENVTRRKNRRKKR